MNRSARSITHDIIDWFFYDRDKKPIYTKVFKNKKDAYKVKKDIENLCKENYRAYHTYLKFKIHNYKGKCIMKVELIDKSMDTDNNHGRVR